METYLDGTACNTEVDISDEALKRYFGPFPVKEEAMDGEATIPRVQKKETQKYQAPCRRAKDGRRTRKLISRERKREILEEWMSRRGEERVRKKLNTTRPELAYKTTRILGSHVNQVEESVGARARENRPAANDHG